MLKGMPSKVEMITQFYELIQIFIGNTRFFFSNFTRATDLPHPIGKEMKWITFFLSPKNQNRKIVFTFTSHPQNCLQNKNHIDTDAQKQSEGTVWR
jgi:hypothetical protein